MVTDFKTLIPNAVTVSFRLECLDDINTVNGILFKLSIDGDKIDYRVHLNKDPRIPIVEPLMEVTCSDVTLTKLVTAMSEPTLDLHVALDTMRRLPMEKNPMERDYGKGEFSKHRA